MKIPIREYISLLSKYLREQRKSVALLAAILSVNIILQLLNPQILRYFIDEATKGEAGRNLTIVALIFMITVIVQQLFNIAATYVTQNIGWMATNGLRMDLMEHCIHLDMKFHKKYQPGELMERVDGDVTALFNFFSSFILSILNNTVLTIGILLLLFREEWRVGISLACFAIFTLCILWHMQKKNVKAWIEERQIRARFFGFLGEKITSTEDICSNGAREYVMRDFYKMLQKMLPINVKAVMSHYNLWSTTLIVFAVGNIVALTLSAYLWKQGAITIGTVYLIFNYTEFLAKPIEEMKNQLQDLQKASASIARVKELFNTKSSIVEGDFVLNGQGPIELSIENITFGYENAAPVLDHLCFKLPKGKILGILGHTGSGKTTLARLITRLYDVDCGQIYLNGQEISSLKFTELTRNIAYVTQDVQLFQATIRQNITMFDPKIEDERIQEVLYEIGLKDWYEGLPNGLDTLMDVEGVGVSAGEAQLLAFVRILLRNPGLIILDEATSRLDPITEHRIEKVLDALLKNRTCIIIAHRLETIKRVDELIILKNGKIVEQGERRKLEKDKESQFYNLLQKGMVEVLE